MGRRHTKESFLKKIAIDENGCWNFTGGKDASGYGQVGYQSKIYQAHRLSYMLHVGEIPKGLLACHKCDNRACINPDHIFLGTYKDNNDDMFAKGRRTYKCIKHDKCRRGHDLNVVENVYTGKNGGRQCRICRNYMMKGFYRLNNCI